MHEILSNKAQISIFILLGLVILIAAAFIINIEDLNFEEDEISSSFDVAPIKLFVERCLNNVGKESLIFVGEHGGYYNLPNPSLEDENFNLPYYFFENLVLTPSIKTIQSELSKYINENLLFCINDFEEFEKQGFEIEYNNVDTNTIIGENDISFIINFPTKIRKDNELTKIDNYNIKIEKMPLKTINEVSQEIINLQSEDPISVCLSCLYDLGVENDLYIDVQKYFNNTLIFDVISFNASITEIYNFTFVVWYPKVSCDNLGGVDDFIFLRDCLEQEKS